MNIKKVIIGSAVGCVVAIMATAQTKTTNIIDEVVWIVGDEAIFRSDVEEQYSQMKLEGTNIQGSPYCVIPEQIAVEKLYLHQAKMDTIEAPETMLSAGVEKRLNAFIAGLGSRERVEAYFHKSIPDLKEQLREVMRTQYIIGQVQESLTKNIKSTPSEVKKYFNSLPADSVPYIPLQVEAQIITFNPRIPQQEIEDVKARLRDYTERVQSGQSEFSTLAIMYSEDGSSVQGGELGFHGKADFVPEFANVAFSLNDPKKVSRIVETEYGYHIIQLIEKRGDQVNVRHILLTPHVSSKDLEDTRVRMDSLRNEIVRGTFTFEEAAQYASQDKDTRNNKGIMMNQTNGSSRFEMKDLPQEAAAMIEKMEPGDISEAFIMKDVNRNKDVIAIVRLTNRIPGHRATLSEDYNLIKEMYESNAKEEAITEWLEKKIRTTYIKIEDGWQNCDFKYNGWLKETNDNK
jgi:peptidyl-prolyl cis-trans isomerase SurA